MAANYARRPRQRPRCVSDLHVGVELMKVRVVVLPPGEALAVCERVGRGRGGLRHLGGGHKTAGTGRGHEEGHDTARFYKILSRSSP